MSAIRRIFKPKIKSPSLWSAPAIISAFLFICMIVIFSVESLGLANREKNLEFRRTSLQILAESKVEDKRTGESIINLDNEIKTQVKLDKEQRSEIIAQMLMDAVSDLEHKEYSEGVIHQGEFGYVDI